MKIVRLGPPLMGKLSPTDGVTVRISEDGRKCVVFFGSLEGDRFVYRGTGFLASLAIGDTLLNYLVTCRHVAEKLDAGFHIRANTRDGAADTEEVHNIDWAYPADRSVDLAVAPLTFSAPKWDVTYLILHRFIPDPYTDPYLGGLSCGDPISIVGLFRLRQGHRRNMPIVHSGNLASLADKQEKIRIKDSFGNGFDAEAYLVEAQTLEGLSGSPVFIHRWVRLPYAGPEGEALASIGSVNLLGVYQGAWDAEPGKVLAEDRGLSGNMRVPVGMGVVVPSEKLLELILMHPKLKKHRDEVIDREYDSDAASSDFASAPPSSDENPKHREDFTRLVGAAARKPAPEG
jgi:hypothetical protein